MGRRIAIAAAVVIVVLVGIGAKRRSVRSGICDGPVLTLNVAPQVACPTDAVTVSWRASDSKAVVSIDGIGDKLVATGSMRVTDGRRTFTGYATNACGRGSTKTVSVSAPPAPAGSISGPESVKQYATATLYVEAPGTSFWTLSSSLGNPISPSSGYGADQATYAASKSGTDGIVLHINGSCDVTTDRSTSLLVEATATPPPSQPPPPPSTGGYLRCCDGTLSKTCTSCANRQGCCSSHGGVCGCGN